MFVLTMITMTMEFGVLGSTICSLLSELRNPHLSTSLKETAKKKRRREVVATSVSLAVSSVTFGITILGAGDFLSGLRIARKQITSAGRAVASMSFDVRAGSRMSIGTRSGSRRQPSSRNCWSETEEAGPDDEILDKCSFRQTADRDGGSATHGKSQ
jgi:hypothetical protein